MSNVLVSTKNMSKSNWLKWRSKGLGGSDAACICGINKYKSPVELWMEKTGQIKPKESGEAAYWGTILEPIVRKEFSLRSNLKVKIIKSMLQHSKYDFMLANLDGVVIDPECGECIFEAKTASIFKSDQWDDDNIPQEYMLQIQHYMAVTGYNKTYIAVLIGGNQFKYKVVERDDELINMLIKLEEDFWEHVVTNTPPPMDGSEASKELLNKLYPLSNAKTQIILPDESINLINQYELSKDKEKEACEMKEEAANKLKIMLGDFECGNSNDRTVLWKSYESEKLDTKKLKEEQPDIYSRYITKSQLRRFSIK